MSVVNTSSLMRAFEAIQEHVDTVLAKLGQREHAKNVVRALLLGYLGYKISKRLYLVFLGPLSHIPGPIFSSLVDVPMWMKKSVREAKLFQTVFQLHEQYGPVVRLGVDRISVSDKAIIKEVLGKQDFPKAEDYKRFQLEGHQTVFSTIDKNFHKHRRRAVSPAFSLRYLGSLEPFLQSCTEKMILNIRQQIANNRGAATTLDIWGLYKHLALDVIGETAFGCEFDMINGGIGEAGRLPGAIDHRMHFAGLRALLPGFVRWTISSKNALESDEYLFKFMSEIIEQRTEATRAEAEQNGQALDSPSRRKKGKRNDILQILIETQFADNEEDRLMAKDIIQETVLFLIAGSETTSNTIAFTIIFLIQHPKVLEALVKEIDSVDLKQKGEDNRIPLPSFDDLKSLPYLNAVIDETLRLRPVTGTGLPRQPPADVVLGGYAIPKNTTINCFTWGCHISDKYWYKPHEFMPERWLDGAEHPADHDAFFPFSIGSRNCIGKNFAWMELRLGIFALLKYFEIGLVSGQEAIIEDLVQLVTVRIKVGKYDITVKERATRA
ncbi:hypothetical protein BZG36_03539 [Bifiguratus adelaidae]|uniref:Cytochrome P450 n=1 Tax=Bifiguratus adelaidae TaxID=1938954 RepID=A0A261XZJ5_9FUNG|nr:hypothetical protein BZG36_03539 [Bifiguratus adelaidae]